MKARKQQKLLQNWPRWHIWHLHCAPRWSSLPVPCIVVICSHVWRNASIHQDQSLGWQFLLNGEAGPRDIIISCSSGAGEEEGQFRLGNCPFHLNKCVFVAFYDEFYVGGITSDSEYREGAIAPQAKIFIFNCRFYPIHISKFPRALKFPSLWCCEIFIEQNSDPLCFFLNFYFRSPLPTKR